MKLGEETFSLEAQFANLRPVEGIYFCVALRENTSGIKDRHNHQ